MATTAAESHLVGYFSGDECSHYPGQRHLYPVALQVSGDCTVIETSPLPWPAVTPTQWCPGHHLPKRTAEPGGAE